MENIIFLRKKYPRFFYRSFRYLQKSDGLHVSFVFETPPDISFRPSVVLKGITPKETKRVGEAALNNLVFHLGLLEMLSYWKATASPEIIIEAGTLNKEQIAWFKDLLMQGMGEYFYQNKIDFTKKNFLTITSAGPILKPILNREKVSSFSRLRMQERVLIPVGGGKDAAVTLELLKKAKVPIRPFLLNPRPEQYAVLGAWAKPKPGLGQTRPVVVERSIDSKLLELNRKGYLNGHTPFSAYLAFLTVLCAALFDYRYIALSNEKSSSEGNVKYLGKTINHQYSKSYEFEKKFIRYSKKYLAKGVEYYSFLRSFSELQIAKIFSKHPKYFPAFLSCNEARKTKSGTKKPTGRWCGKCAKCLFVFAILYPFVEEKQLTRIFKKNLFRDSSLIPLMEELIGERAFKPFECVGTTRESRAAFLLSLKKSKKDLPPLLRHFKEKVLAG